MKDQRNGHQSLKWIYESEADAVGAVLELSKEKVHHLFRVLRFPESSDVIVSNGKGTAFTASLTQTSKSSARLLLKEIHKDESQRPPKFLRVFVALPKNNIMDFIMEKAVELGVQHISPFMSERSVVRIKSSEADKYLEKWKEQAVHALEQSEGLWFPKIDAPKEFTEILKEFSAPTFLFSSEKREETTMKDSLKALEKAAQGGIGLIFGPEGGFSKEETRIILENHGKPLTLGTSILRVETAFIAGVHMAKLAM